MPVIRSSARMRRMIKRPHIAMALGLGLVLAIGAQLAIGDAGRDVVGVAYLAGALLFAAASLAAAAGGAPAPAPSRRWELRLLIAIAGVAVLFRIHDFYRFPPGLWYDEAVNGLDAIAIMEHGNHLSVWQQSNNGHSTIYFYLLIASFKLFGFTVFAMRIVPVVAGLMAVGALYVLARRLFGSVAALAAAGLMSVSRYAVTFSRISWEASLEPLFEILAIYFLARALDTRRRLDWFMAGGSLAAGLYTYAAFRLMPFVPLVVLAYVAATRWTLIRSNLPGLALYAASFTVVVLPLAQYTIRHSDSVTRRQRTVSVFRQIDQQDSYQPLISNIKRTAQMFNVRGDPNGRHNLPGEPMLDPISAALLVLGVGVAIASFRRWKRGMLVPWLLITLAASPLTLTYENPSAIRTIGVLPPVFLLIGLAVDTLWRAVSPGGLEPEGSRGAGHRARGMERRCQLLRPLRPTGGQPAGVRWLSAAKHEDGSSCGCSE